MFDVEFFLNENAKATWIMITPLVTSNSYLYIAPRLNSLIQRFYSRHHKLVVVTMASKNQYISIMFERCQFKSLWKLMI
jgi:hypothetical protein